ncbi:unnamed protein product, partial [Ectocarpus fasciculatus]
LLCRLRVVSASQTVPELLRTVLEETGMHKHVTETLSTTGPAEGEDRWQNVVELERAASNPKFSGIAGDGALVAFLNEVALVGGDDPEQARKQREEEEAAAGVGDGGQAPPVPGVSPPMIQLMTVHASKGLEFDTVFVAGCEEGTFPMKDTTDDEMDEERRLMYVGMTRAKARLFLSWRKQRMVFGQSWGKRDKTGAQIMDADRSRFLDDIPRNIVRTIDKTTGGGGIRPGGAGAGNRRGAYGGGDGRSQSSQRRGDYGASPSYGGGGGGGRRGAARGGRGVSEPESDPTMDFMTELSNDISRQATARRSPGGYTSGYGNSGQGGGGRRAGNGYGGGGGRGRGGGAGSYASERNGDARVFMEQRKKVESAKYPVPALTDGGRRLARESGEGVDTSWAAKLVNAKPGTPGPPRGVVVGAQVTHPTHGRGEVVALVEGSEGVNVRFVSQGQPFLTRVLGSKLKLVR